MSFILEIARWRASRSRRAARLRAFSVVDCAAGSPSEHRWTASAPVDREREDLLACVGLGRPPATELKALREAAQSGLAYCMRLCVCVGCWGAAAHAQLTGELAHAQGKEDGFVTNVRSAHASLCTAKPCRRSVLGAGASALTSSGRRLGVCDDGSSCAA
eukprot:6185431-Pleurochrysis_carterae.AAC.2